MKVCVLLVTWFSVLATGSPQTQWSALPFPFSWTNPFANNQLLNHQPPQNHLFPPLVPQAQPQTPWIRPPPQNRPKHQPPSLFGQFQWSWQLPSIQNLIPSPSSWLWPPIPSLPPSPPFPQVPQVPQVPQIPHIQIPLDWIRPVLPTQPPNPGQNSWYHPLQTHSPPGQNLWYHPLQTHSPPEQNSWFYPRQNLPPHPSPEPPPSRPTQPPTQPPNPPKNPWLRPSAKPSWLFPRPPTPQPDQTQSPPSRPTSTRPPISWQFPLSFPSFATIQENLYHIIDRINSQQAIWKAGRNFSPNTTYSQLLELAGVEWSTATVLFSRKMKDPYWPMDDQIPEFFDAREKWKLCTVIGQVLDQSQCGSCWAMAPAQVATDRYCIASGGKHNIRLSGQEILDCSVLRYRSGCKGGAPAEAYQFLRKNGLVSGGGYKSHEGCKPYFMPKCAHHGVGTYTPCNLIPQVTPICNATCSNKRYRIRFEDDIRKFSSIYKLGTNEKWIQKDIMTYGPVSTQFQVHEDFFLYKSGVYEPLAPLFVTPQGIPRGHTLKMIGWGTENGVPYWLCLNTWNEHWGDNGIVKMRRRSPLLLLELMTYGAIPQVDFKFYNREYYTGGNGWGSSPHSSQGGGCDRVKNMTATKIPESSTQPPPSTSKIPPSTTTLSNFERTRQKKKELNLQENTNNTSLSYPQNFPQKQNQNDVQSASVSISSGTPLISTERTVPSSSQTISPSTTFTEPSQKISQSTSQIPSLSTSHSNTPDPFTSTSPVPTQNVPQDISLTPSQNSSPVSPQDLSLSAIGSNSESKSQDNSYVPVQSSTESQFKRSSPTTPQNVSQNTYDNATVSTSKRFPLKTLETTLEYNRSTVIVSYVSYITTPLSTRSTTESSPRSDDEDSAEDTDESVPLSVDESNTQSREQGNSESREQGDSQRRNLSIRQSTPQDTTASIFQNIIQGIIQNMTGMLPQSNPEVSQEESQDKPSASPNVRLQRAS